VDEKTEITTVDQYIGQFPADVQERLIQMRDTIRAAAPDAQEILSYGMPAYAQAGNLVYFGAAKAHIGFYPTPQGVETFAEEFSAYKGNKGSVQFPNNQPLPLDLVRRVTESRVEQNLAKAAAKKGKGKNSGSFR
jgi:uncharacterized protein YdhG (YjbR/CyaY superfamily)